MKSPERIFPLLPRKKRADKSSYGHALIIAGSRGMTGAAVLAAMAAMRSGAGLVTLAAPEELSEVLRKKCPPEVMFLALSQTSRGTVAKKATAAVTRYVWDRRVNAIAIGPGLTDHPETAAFVRGLVRVSLYPVVLDADGLNAFRDKTDLLVTAKSPLILTPHKREFERLFEQECPASDAARLRLAKKVSARYHGVLVLKGYRTVVAQERQFFVNLTGNPGLAKGGSGDALTGMMAAFLAQGLSAFRAAAWAVYFHGLAADLAVRQMSELSLTASDVIRYLPSAFKKGRK